jgi:hypothetical protein
MATPDHKEIFEASFIIQRALRPGSNAMHAAYACEADRARRLRDRTRVLIRDALAKLATATPAARRFYSTDDVVRRIAARLQADMNRVEGLLRRCRPMRGVNFQKSGSFAKSKDMQPGQSGKNKILLEFNLSKKAECEKLCLISVYYVEVDETGKRLTKPSKGYKDTFDPLLGGLLPDGDAAAGYIVDAPERVLAGAVGQLRLVPSNSPCMPTSKQVRRKITARDSPNFLKPGHTAWFETCLVCLDRRPKFEILGSVRWRHSSGETRLLPKDGSLDRKRASDGFVQALELYLANRP